MRSPFVLAPTLLLIIACGPKLDATEPPPTNDPSSMGGGTVEPELPDDPNDPLDDVDAGEEVSQDPNEEAPDASTPTDGRTNDGGTQLTPDAGPPDHRPFRVMSYNIRGPFDTGAHSWDRRRPNVIALIKDNAPDIVGLQEVMVTNGEDMPADMIAGLQATYGYYRPSGGSPKVIFYKTSRFTRLAQGTQNLPNPYASSNVCYDRANGKKLSWVKLRDKLTNKEYFFANTHLAWSDGCGLGRLRQAQEIKRQIDALSGSLPVIITGDFNTDPQKPSLANEGTIEAMEGDGNRTLYRTARHDGTTNADDATFNSRWYGSGTNNACIDYIFHSGKEITSSAPTVDRSPDTATGSPSDHFPILATIRGAVFEPGSTLVQVQTGEAADTTVYFADVDGDRCADQISWSPTQGNGSTWWAKSSCSGTFSAPREMNGATSGAASTRFSFADVTGDGCADKVFWRPTYAAGEIRVYQGNCDGSFKPVVALPNTVSESENTFFFFARVTADRCADLVRWNAGQSNGQLTVYPSACNGTVSFGAGVTAAGGAQTTAGTKLWFADVDGDGKEDEIAWHPDVAGGRTRVFRSTGTGTFTTGFEHSAGSSGVATSRFYFADLDGDGKADKVFWRPTFRHGRMQIYLSAGTNFAGSPIMDNTGFSESENTDFHFADTNRDGAADKTYWNPGANGGSSKVFRSRH